MKRLLSIAVLCALSAALWYWPGHVMFAGLALAIVALLMGLSFLAGVVWLSQLQADAKSEVAALQRDVERAHKAAEALEASRVAASPHAAASGRPS